MNYKVSKAIKKILVTQKEENTCCNITIRMNPGFKIQEYEFPPTEKINGKKLNIIEARQLGISELSYSILFNKEDLHSLYSSLRSILED